MVYRTKPVTLQSLPLNSHFRSIPNEDANVSGQEAILMMSRFRCSFFSNGERNTGLSDHRAQDPTLDHDFSAKTALSHTMLLLHLWTVISHDISPCIAGFYPLHSLLSPHFITFLSPDHGGLSLIPCFLFPVSC